MKYILICNPKDKAEMETVIKELEVDKEVSIKAHKYALAKSFIMCGTVDENFCFSPIDERGCDIAHKIFSRFKERANDGKDETT